MASFKKPTRKFAQRTRLLEQEDDDHKEIGGTEENVHHVPTSLNQEREKAEIKKEKKKKEKDKEKEREKKPPALLSFGDEMEGDDGEVFKVKKSSQSRKLLRERKKKKVGKTPDPLTEKKQEDNFQTETEVPYLVVKQTIKRESSPILSGKDAEAIAMAEEDLFSDEDEKPLPFSDPFKQLLGSGIIPNAAMIHEARKRRQRARELGEDFIPLDDTQRVRDDKSRLVRDDDNDLSDLEEDREKDRMSFTVDTKKERSQFKESLNKEGSESEGELELWEAQQIKKGFTERGNQITFSQLKSEETKEPRDMNLASSPPYDSSIPTFAPGEILSLKTIREKLSDRLLELTSICRRHVADRDRIVDDLSSCEVDIKECEDEMPKAAHSYEFHQETRAYISDLIDCYNAKMDVIIALEDRMHGLLRQRAEELMVRRRQDVQDQNEEVNLAIKKVASLDTERSRRTAEREGRRMRRKKKREASSLIPSHKEGLSSDDEESETKISVFLSEKEKIKKDAEKVFADVLDDFSQLEQVKQHLEQWKCQESDSYQEAFVSLCLPKIFSPIVRLEVLFWNPLMEENAMDFTGMHWFACLVSFFMGSDLRKDSDLKLIPSVVDRVLLPKLTALVECSWDPLSRSQTLRLVRLINRWIDDFGTVVNGQSAGLRSLLKTVLCKLRDCLNSDLFIPLFSKQVLLRDPSAASFYQRQFWTGLKLLHNALNWQGLLKDSVLQDLTLNSLLNRYLVTSLTNSLSYNDAKEKVATIVNMLPRSWLASKIPCKELGLFVSFVKSLPYFEEAPADAKAMREKEVQALLKTLGSAV